MTVEYARRRWHRLSDEYCQLLSNSLVMGARGNPIAAARYSGLADEKRREAEAAEAAYRRLENPPPTLFG